MALITLLTDFGLRDAYVGAMKGVIAGRAPGVPVVDICHDIEPHAVRRAGLVWRSVVPYFPGGTVHVAVVDPGVGSRRQILAVEARGSIFLAPDNGLIGYALGRRDVRRVRRVTRRELFLEPVSDTFHGRDIFAPVAAQLALGLPLEKVGPAARSYRWEGLPTPRRRRRGTVVELRGEIVDLDRFGNATTNLVNLASGENLRFVELAVGTHVLPRLSTSYAAVRRGKPLVIVGSLGFLEVAVNQGSAHRALDLQVGDRVTARWRLAKAD